MGTGKTRRNAKYRNAFEMALAPQEKKLNADLNKYKDFVQEVTSLESNSTMVLNNKLIDLEKETGVNIALLLTASIGMASEGGEFSEIVKKCFPRQT